MTGTEARPVGFVGLGQIGAPMARHLVDWPDGLVVFDVRPEACEPLAEAGAHVAGDLADLGRRCGVVCIMVRDDDQVREVTRTIAPHAAAGTVLVVHSTISETTAVALAAEMAEVGLLVVDAPVSGGFLGAHDGNLAVMIGGTDRAVETCRPVLDCFAGLVVHLGPPGAGTRAKIARNLISFASFAVVGEAQRLAEAAGIALEDLAAVVRHSDAITGGPGAIMLRGDTAALADDDPLRAIMVHTRELGEKDLALARVLGHELGVDLPFASLAQARLGAALGVPHDDDPDVEE